MLSPECIVVYVENVAVSVGFYTRIFGKAPIEASKDFAMYAFENGLTLGVWAKQAVQPMPKHAGGGAEIGFVLKTKSDVDSLYQEWKALEYSIAQEPQQMDFGYTFTGLDPDGHRLRIFVPQPT